MRRLLAPVAVAAILSLRPGPAAAEPLDLDLARLGAPSEAVWTKLAEVHGVAAPAHDAALLASEAKTRFAILSAETALALSSAILTPASTTGYAGFDVDLEAAYVAVHPQTVGYHLVRLVVRAARPVADPLDDAARALPARPSTCGRRCRSAWSSAGG